MRAVGGHGRKLTYYDFGQTTVYASRHDKRFAYCAYVPEDYEEDGHKTYPLAVIVHGTERGMLAYRDAFSDFAEEHGVILLCPLFPANICFPGDLSSYKLLRAGDLHYDAVLLDMIEEMRGRYRIEGNRFMMYGFSGGGHFTHRFLYLHPERLLAASIGAPGIVTLLDFDQDFWVGVRDFEAVFGKAVDLDAVRGVAVQMIVGGDDTETWEITPEPGDAWWMPGAELAGKTRIDRLHSLKNSFDKHRIGVELEVVPGSAHDDRQLIVKVKEFFKKALSEIRTRA
ncbi:hypothetical protein A33O_15286 [Nitratireductor aquibiodomus RA22]|uniref:Poly(Aspartic acid) hydrolase n=1 Tax=Nitratireductor aquibiodomus RA22 TaxID=1189611 RepID=I5BVE8_9HYPH|nr:hypothetical protein [Nitratireductor aquibiodomus]EIM73550.1 hypothetical protein A33O_15286 [Nitratireductor aquibiodomus RA22]